MKGNNGQWTTNLAREGMESVLSLMVVGIHQPPMRIGCLRLLHNPKSMEERDDVCAYEHCK